jgi:methylthioribulose-1-phosphate dehydratase
MSLPPSSIDPMPAVPPAELVAPLSAAVARWAARGWLDGDVGDFSLVASREPLRLWISLPTRSRHHLQPTDFVLVDHQGKSLDPEGPAPPPEAQVHAVLAEHLAHLGCIVHTQSCWSELLTDRPYPQNNLPLEPVETLRALPGLTAIQRVAIKVFDQPQEWHELVRRLRLVLPENSAALRYGFFLKRHGLYTWGRDVEDARRHVEVIEHLLEYKARQLMLGQG